MIRHRSRAWTIAILARQSLSSLSGVTRKRLKAAGVEFIEEPKDYGTLWLATLKDPEGNLVQLVQLKN